MLEIFEALEAISVSLLEIFEALEAISVSLLEIFVEFEVIWLWTPVPSICNSESTIFMGILLPLASVPHNFWVLLSSLDTREFCPIWYSPFDVFLRRISLPLPMLIDPSLVLLTELLGWTTV